MFVFTIKFFRFFPFAFFFLLAASAFDESGNYVIRKWRPENSWSGIDNVRLCFFKASCHLTPMEHSFPVRGSFMSHYFKLIHVTVLLQTAQDMLLRFPCVHHVQQGAAFLFLTRAQTYFIHLSFIALCHFLIPSVQLQAFDSFLLPFL